MIIEHEPFIDDSPLPHRRQLQTFGDLKMATSALWRPLKLQEAEEELRTDDEELAAWMKRKIIQGQTAGNTGGFTAMFFVFVAMIFFGTFAKNTTFLQHL